MSQTNIDSAQVISDLVELLTEDQLIEYAKKIGLEKVHPHFNAKRFKQLQSTLSELIEENPTNRKESLKDALLDYVFYGLIPAQGGKIFQKQAASWLKSLGGILIPKHQVQSTQVGRKFIDVDVHIKKESFPSDVHVWAEVKVPKIKTRHVTTLLRNATDLHMSSKKKPKNWSADILMMISMSGFSEEALDIANQSKIYCVHYNPNRWSIKGKRPNYRFVGSMTREQYNENVFSNYPKYR